MQGRPRRCNRCCHRQVDACTSGSLFPLIQPAFTEHLLCANSVQSTEDISGNQQAKAGCLLCGHGDRQEAIGELVKHGVGRCHEENTVGRGGGVDPLWARL